MKNKNNKKIDKNYLNEIKQKQISKIKINESSEIKNKFYEFIYVFI